MNNINIKHNKSNTRDANQSEDINQIYPKLIENDEYDENDSELTQNKNN